MSKKSEASKKKVRRRALAARPASVLGRPRVLGPVTLRVLGPGVERSLSASGAGERWTAGPEADAGDPARPWGADGGSVRRGDVSSGFCVIVVQT